MLPAPPAYVIDARLDPVAHEVKGRLALRYFNRGQQPLKQLYFQLYPNNFKPGSRFFRSAGQRYNLDTFFPDGRDPGWLAVRDVRVEGTSVPGRTQDAFLAVPLPHALAPGQGAVVTLGFTTHVPQLYDRFGRVGDDYSLAYWYPRIAARTGNRWDLTPRTTPLQEFHDEHADFDVRLALPKNWGVGATGHLVTRDLATSPAERVWHYEASEVRAFCAVFSPRLHEVAQTRDGLTVHVLSYADEAAGVPRVLAQTFEMVKFYSALVGAYPYADLTIASSEALPVGGVELPQLVLNSRLLTRVETLAGDWVEAGYTALNAHEVAHQWFFGVLGNDEVHETWIDESFATWMAMRFLERPGSPEGGRPVRLLGSLAWLDHLFPFATQRESQLGTARLPDRAGLAMPLTTPLVDMPLAQIAPTYYARGPVVIEMLRQTLGDEAFGRFLHGLYLRYAYQDLTTTLIQREAERAAGRSLQGFFDTWIRGAGAVLDHHLVSWRQEPIGGGRLRAIARITQHGTTDLPVGVSFKLRSGREVLACYMPGVKEVEVEVDSPVVAVDIDPEGCELERSVGRRGGTRTGLLPVAAEDLPISPGGPLAPPPGRRGSSSSAPIGPGPLAPNVNLDLSNIKSAHRGFSIGWLGGQPTGSLGLEEPIYGLGNYDSSIAGGIAHRPEGNMGGIELGLAWEPVLGENPRYGFDLGAERRVYPTSALAQAGSVAVNAVQASVLMETRRVLYGVRPAGGRYRLGVEVAPPWLDTTGSFVSPFAELIQHADVGWDSTVSLRGYGAATLGTRSPLDALRLDREGLFRTYGVGTGNALMALNLEWTHPLSGAFYPPLLPVPMILHGLTFLDAGWTGTPTWEAGLGLRLGLASIGQASVGLDWVPYCADFGWQPLACQLKGGYAF